MIKKGIGMILFLLILLPVCAEISLVPEAQLLIDQALKDYEEDNFKNSLELFKQASLLDPENQNILDLIDSLDRLVTLENYDSNSDVIDSFIEKREKEKQEAKNEPENNSQDYLNKERNKEIAKQERPIGGLEFYYPLFYSSTGNWETDNSMSKTDDPFKGVAYSLDFFPDLFNRIIGVEGKYESYPLAVNNTLYIFDEARIGLVLKNYFREQPGSYSLVGTKISAGMIFGENIDNNSRQMYTSWQFEIFVRDPLLYRFVQNDFTSRLGFEGRFQFSLLDITYILSYGGALEFQMGDFLLSSQLLYRSLTDQNVLNSSWVLSAGVKYYFR